MGRKQIDDVKDDYPEIMPVWVRANEQQKKLIAVELIRKFELGIQVATLCEILDNDCAQIDFEAEEIEWEYKDYIMRSYFHSVGLRTFYRVFLKNHPNKVLFAGDLCECRRYCDIRQEKVASQSPKCNLRGFRGEDWEIERELNAQRLLEKGRHQKYSGVDESINLLVNIDLGASYDNSDPFANSA